MKWIRIIFRHKPQNQESETLENATRNLLGIYTQALTQKTKGFYKELRIEFQETYKFIHSRLLHSLKLKEKEYTHHTIALELLEDSIDSLKKSLPDLKPNTRESLLVSIHIFSDKQPPKGLIRNTLLKFPESRLEAYELTDHIQNLGIALNARLGATETIINILKAKGELISAKENLACHRIESFYLCGLHIRDLLHKRFLQYSEYTIPHMKAGLHFGKHLYGPKEP